MGNPLLEPFVDGQEGSSSRFRAALEDIEKRQLAILDSLRKARTEYLLRFQSGLSLLTLRSCRAAAQPDAASACRFSLEAMHGLDMEATTASIRCDSRSATLREQKLESPEPVQAIRFSASAGSVEPAGNAWRVISPEVAPEGIFTLELARPLVIHQAVFDVILATPSADISVETSLDGQNWQDGPETGRSGYRILAWMPRVLAHYVRLRIRPRQPDGPGSDTYTFGLTDASVFSTRYHLRGLVRFKPRIWKPTSTRVRFQAPGRDGIDYFLSLLPFSGPLPDGQDGRPAEDLPGDPRFAWSGSYASVEPGQVLDLPDSARRENLPARLVQSGSIIRLEYQVSGQWLIQLPQNLLWSSLRVADQEGSLVPVWPDMLPIPGSGLTGFAEAGGILYWIGPVSGGILERQWTVSFATAPPAVIARFLVQLSSRNLDRTPVAGEAWLEEIPDFVS